eukprot:SAG31_NODE_43893_length_265_cov_0.626506_1_plen_41_part_10
MIDLGRSLDSAMEPQEMIDAVAGAGVVLPSAQYVLSALADA